MPDPSRSCIAVVVAFFLLALAPTGSLTGEQTPPDPLSAELDRLSAIVSNNTSTSKMSLRAREDGEAGIVGARNALRAGRRLLALRRIAAAHERIVAGAYAAEPRDGRNDIEALERAWKRARRELGVDAAAPQRFADNTPSAALAIAEAALSKMRVYHSASLDYGRNTTPDSGFYYLGAARAQFDLARLCGALRWPSHVARKPPLRSLVREIEALERQLLGAYHPPASIDDHPRFIAASATLKEARELDAAGLSRGALLRYLEAAQQVATIRPGSEEIDQARLVDAVDGARRRMSASDVDHSIGGIFLEEAADDLEPASAGNRNQRGAAVILNEVLPRYFAALEPQPAGPARPNPVLTVTLVRWPYT